MAVPFSAVRAHAGEAVDLCVARRILSISTCRKVYGNIPAAQPMSPVLQQYYRERAEFLAPSYPRVRGNRYADLTRGYKPEPTPAPQKVEVEVHVTVRRDRRWAPINLWNLGRCKSGKFAKHRMALGYSIPGDKAVLNCNRRGRIRRR